MSTRAPPYRLSVLQLGRRFVLPLPKLTTHQMRTIEKRLVGLGYEVSRSRGLNARKPGKRISVFATGFCVSGEDPTDVIAPILPDLLASTKEMVRASSMLQMYFQWKADRSGDALRFTSRLEAGGIWDELRRRDLCGITPDESTVLRHVLKNCSGTCVLVTDFPVEGSVKLQASMRGYYWSPIQAERVGEVMRGIGGKGDLNAYLPRSGILSLKSFNPLSRLEELSVARNLGDWCSFEPMGRERSNCGTRRGHEAPVV